MKYLLEIIYSFELRVDVQVLCDLPYCMKQNDVLLQETNTHVYLYICKSWSSLFCLFSNICRAHLHRLHQIVV